MTLPVLRLAGVPLPLVGPARIYVCGITPYDVTHLGHASTFVWADVLARILRGGGVETATCRNITDVDDVLDAAAHRAGAYVDRFAAVQQFRFDQDMTALGVRRPEHEPRARGHIGQVIRLAGILLDGGHAYRRGGSVFLPGEAVARRAGLDQGRAGALVEEFGGHHEAAENALDAVVWQSSSGDEPAWDSPWGRGRPGWHAECAAMALATFGSSVDVHAGGRDLAFPHHAFEAAMAEAATGVVPFARGWLHVGAVRKDGRKMAKSVGNLVLVGDLLASYPAPAVRLLILDRPWASDWDFEPAAVDAAAGKLQDVYAAAARSSGPTSAVPEVERALLDELDVPRALSIGLEAGGEAARRLSAILGLL
ncbi:MAG TPA: cysteine--1-D-myo-inosityl 2-amino-2-deoxy-alpha-D-glucopyranoside ligase [Mycobacteriales bacterium]|nr:cysteine--1-D-myo-inosityl 2-amino-2-deoxy-alpha-D-glucopyranoside ligase [Mycobacteriales bacterium]